MNKYHIELAGLHGNTFSGPSSATIKHHPFLYAPPEGWGGLKQAWPKRSSALGAIVVLGIVAYCWNRGIFK